MMGLGDISISFSWQIQNLNIKIDIIINDRGVRTGGIRLI